MSVDSKIEWTDATWNPVSGCTRVSAGCDHCYAVQQTYRMGRMGLIAKYDGLTVLNGKGDRHFNGVVRTHEDALDIPLKRRKPTVYFVNSMSDLFHKDVPFEFIDRVFAVMALCPQHTFQVLTKRPERMAEYTQRYCKDGIASWPTDAGGRIHRHPWIVAGRELAKGRGSKLMNDAAVVAVPLPNVWLGTSCEDQATADERIQHLLRCPAAVRFLSLEPLLSKVTLWPWLNEPESYSIHGRPKRASGASMGIGPSPIHWVIVGGESGPKARPCDVGWIRSIIEQCKAAGVRCFVKQLGSRPYENEHIGKLPGAAMKHPKGGDPSEWPDDLRVREFPQ